MSRQPRVSIIIPCWNAEKYIADAIGSCLGQSYTNLEVVVVNDGSNDGSQSVIDRFEGRIVSITTENGGANRARNIGLESSTGDLIKFLDADDYLWPGSIAKQVEHMNSLKSDEFSVGESYRYVEGSNLLHKYPGWNRTKDRKEAIAQFFRLPPNTSSPMYRKHCLSAINNFDIKVLARQEVDLFYRYTLNDNCPVLMESPIYVWRDHDSPWRISSGRSKDIRESDIQLFERAVISLKSKKNNPDYALAYDAMALAIWTMGRGMSRSGHVNEASRCFNLAKKCGTKRYIEGKWIYRTIVRFGDPVYVERTLTSLKRMFVSS